MSGPLRLATVLALAALQGSLALPAAAADLYFPPNGSYGNGYGYDEQRYLDGDAYEAPRFERYGAAAEDDDAPYPPSALLDDDDAFAPYRYDKRRYSAHAGECLPRHEVRDRLRAEGWRDLYGFEPRGRVVLIQARGPSGHLYDLTIDRCSAEVIDARSLDHRGFDDYYAQEPRRRWSY
jgi:hypothetical protein